jgi:hypothetical protein
MISELDSSHTPLHRGDHDYKEFGNYVKSSQMRIMIP